MFLILIFVVLLHIFHIFAQTGCYDTDESTCYYWRISGMCEHRSYYNLMYETCRRTCNLCPSVSVIQPAVVVTSATKCQDKREECPAWKKHCKESSQYYNFMKKNCQRSCLFCADENCINSNKKCERYQSYGYCDRYHKYFSYMKRNCARACEFCEQHMNATSTPQNLTKEFLCDFEKHTCDWENQHFEDTADWTVGVLPNAPMTGYNNSKSYLYLDTQYRGSQAKLWLPWQLVLPESAEKKGVMCFNMMYQLNGGEVKVIQTAVSTAFDKFPSPSILFSTKVKALTWSHARFNVHVSKGYYITLIGEHGRPMSFIAIDYVYFTNGKC